MCLVELFQENKIQSVDEWEKMCRPKKIIAYLPKTELEKTK